MELMNLTALELGKAIKAGETTSVEATEATFAAIEDVILLTDSVPEGAFRDIPNIVDITSQPLEA